jgi:hypothetical protein
MTGKTAVRDSSDEAAVLDSLTADLFDLGTRVVAVADVAGSNTTTDCTDNGCSGNCPSVGCSASCADCG